MRRYKIALTGTLGSLGSRLVRRLEAQDACRRLVLLGLVPPAREALEREGVDVLVHLAFLQHPPRNPGYQHELESLGTMHLVHALTHLAQAGAAPHVVLGATTLAYGARATNPSFLGEDSPLAAPRDHRFVAEKIGAERQLARLNQREGVAVTVMRLAPILSPDARTLAGRYLSLPAVPTILGFNPM